MAKKETLGFLLSETARVWRTRLDQRLRPLGLSQAKWRVLVYLRMADCELTQKSLSDRLGVEGPTLVRLLDRMEADGWVERRPSPDDRRAKLIHPTERARGVIRDIERIAAELRAELLAGIPARDLTLVSDVLQRIKNRAEQL